MNRRNAIRSHALDLWGRLTLYGIFVSLICIFVFIGLVFNQVLEAYPRATTTVMLLLAGIFLLISAFQSRKDLIRVARGLSPRPKAVTMDFRDEVALARAIEDHKIHQLPTVARRLLIMSVPTSAQHDVSVELARRYSAKIAQQGRLGATIWLWKEVLLFPVLLAVVALVATILGVVIAGREDER